MVTHPTRYYYVYKKYSKYLGSLHSERHMKQRGMAKKPRGLCLEKSMGAVTINLIWPSPAWSHKDTRYYQMMFPHTTNEIYTIVDTVLICMYNAIWNTMSYKCR